MAVKSGRSFRKCLLLASRQKRKFRTGEEVPTHDSFADQSLSEIE